MRNAWFYFINFINRLRLITSWGVNEIIFPFKFILKINRNQFVRAYFKEVVRYDAFHCLFYAQQEIGQVYAHTHTINIPLALQSVFQRNCPKSL